MADKVEIKCPTCGGLTAADAEVCEVCGLAIERSSVDQSTAQVTPDTMDCPSCAETIKRRATKCRFCGYDLVAQQQPEPVQSAPAAIAFGVATRPGCPVCHSKLPPVRKRKGSLVFTIILLLFWLLPGIIYMFLYSGSMFVCPQCGYKYGDAN